LVSTNAIGECAPVKNLYMYTCVRGCACKSVSEGSETKEA